jgi:hypothetical protein
MGKPEDTIKETKDPDNKKNLRMMLDAFKNYRSIKETRSNIDLTNIVTKEDVER